MGLVPLAVPWQQFEPEVFITNRLGRYKELSRIPYIEQDMPDLQTAFLIIILVSLQMKEVVSELLLFL